MMTFKNGFNLNHIPVDKLELGGEREASRFTLKAIKSEDSQIHLARCRYILVGTP